MVARRSQSPPEADPPPRDWSNLLSFGGLAGAVVGVLLLGAALRTDAPPATPLPDAPPRSAGLIPAEDRGPAVPETTRPPEAVSPAAPATRLAGRAAADLERMSARPAGWTAQLAVLCDTKRVTALTERFGDHENYYLLPVLHGKSACFRICWNHYRTREAAASAADLPRAMRAIEARPLPKAVAEIVE